MFQEREWGMGKGLTLKESSFFKSQICHGFEAQNPLKSGCGGKTWIKKSLLLLALKLSSVIESACEREEEREREKCV